MAKLQVDELLDAIVEGDDMEKKIERTLRAFQIDSTLKPLLVMATGSGSNSYYEESCRSYGFYLFENHFNIMYGAQTYLHDPNLSKRWSCFLPWTEWRFVRHSYYNLAGWGEIPVPQDLSAWRMKDDLKITNPEYFQTFLLKDYDEEVLEAIVNVEEREWLLGTGVFKWLSALKEPKIRRTLDIEFSGETGKRKGSWKGGTIGCSIDMVVGDTPETAFRRYCSNHNMTFLGEKNNGSV